MKKTKKSIDPVLFLKGKGWDGKYPIPVTYEGRSTLLDLEDISYICSGDDHCFWAVNVESACKLLNNGHNLIKDKKVLEKRQSYLDNPDYKALYAFWYD